MKGKIAIGAAPLTPDPRAEQVLIPPDRSHLWRIDDYPTPRAVWNHHPEVEIHLIRYSSGMAYVGDHIGPFEGGDLCFIGSNLPHDWVSSDLGGGILRRRDVVVQFAPDRMRAGCAAFPELAPVTAFLDRAARGVAFHGATARKGRRMIEGMAGLPPGQATAELLRILSLLAASTECRYLASRSFVRSLGPDGSKQQDRIDRALGFLQDHFLDRPSLRDGADLVGMSDSVFSRFFKRRTGTTFTDHLVSLRIGCAQRLLAASDDAITDVCYQSGFNNISNFNRTFLRRVGMAPSAYRNAARGRKS